MSANMSVRVIKSQKIAEKNEKKNMKVGNNVSEHESLFH